MDRPKSPARATLLVAVLALLAFGALPLKTHAASSTIFDTFDVDEGHFNQHPTYSGSTTGIATTSTANRVTGTAGVDTIEGAGAERLVLYPTAATARVRFLSALGSPGGNTAFTTSSATDGWIGCFVKTSDPGWNVQLWLEGASVNGGVPKNIIADGQWHVYEWNLEDTSGGADGWGNIAGLVSGSATVSDGSHTIDSVVFRSTTAVPGSTVTIDMDFVARYSDGTISNLINEPCLLTPAVSVTGPLSTNENIVRVRQVVSTATAITIYQNAGTGFTNTHSQAVSSPGTSVNVTVPAGKLIKGAQIAATQTIAGQESCITPNATVGSGSSAPVKIAASIGQPGGIAGPVGRNHGSTGNNIYWVHATGSAVGGGLVISPSANWQTIAFYPPTDNKYVWNGTFAFPDPNQYGVFEGFAMACGDNSDSGPMQIYFDNFRQAINGVETIVQNFEGVASGTTEVLLRAPNVATTTQNALLGAPNASVISSTHASTGVNSLGMNYQFNTCPSWGSSPWVRTLAQGANGNPATAYPVVDLTQPILVDVLVLPVGQTVSHPLGRITPLSAYQQSVCPNDPVTFSVQVTPPDGTTPTYTYQWRRNNSSISGATASSYTIASATAANSGTYTVIVSDGTASATVRSTILSVPTAVQIDTPPVDQLYVADPGGSASFTAAVSIPANCPCASSPAIAWRWCRNGVPLEDGANVMGATGSGDSPQFPALTLMNVDYSFAGDYTVIVTNLCSGQTVTSSGGKMWVTPHPAISVTCGQQGLLDLDYTNQPAAYPPNPAFSGSPAATNAIQGIPFGPVDYNWSSNSFGTATGQFLELTNHYRIRFVGSFQPPFDPGAGQLYTFYTRSDDGNRLWVNGQLVIDSWKNQGMASSLSSGSILLTTNNPVPIILEYYENTGDAGVMLAYSSPSVMSNTIPASQLCPAVPGQTGGGGIPPMITLTAPASPTTVTNAASVNLAATVTQEDATINSVQFFDGATPISGVIATPPFSATWSSPPLGVHTVTARLTYNGTETLTTPVATVTNYPAAPTAGNNGPVCAGSPLNLTATGAAGTYAWTGPNSFTSSQQNPTIASPTTAASGTYSVTVTVGGLKSAAGTTPVTVNAVPAAPTAGNNGPITAGQTLNLTATTVAGATYAWTGPNGFVSSDQNPSIPNATTAASGTYNVTATVNGCTSAQGSTTATVNAAPSKASVNVTSVVNNGNGTITINYTGGAGASFTLMKTSDPTLARDSWTVVTPDQPLTPGSFTITPAGKEFYSIRSN